MKLGEVLIAEGVITEEQLEQALDAQLMYGGHLGTCLIELGCLSEERLGEALAQASGVPYAAPTCFYDIPHFVVNTLPKSIVQTHSAIPILLKDGILDVAMIDPRSQQALDDIRAVSGHTVRSWIAPQIRIFQAMEHYYDVPRRIRYVTSCRTLDGDTSLLGGAYAGAFDCQEAPPEAAPTANTKVTLPNPAADSLGAVSERLAWAETEDQIADLVLGAMQGTLRRRILFKVHGNTASVWKTEGVDLDSEAISFVRFPVLAESIFGLLRGDDYYAGPLPQDPIHLGFYRKLAIDKPAQILLIPVHVDDQLVAVFYADDRRNGTIVLDIDSQRRLLQKAALALNVVQAREKICSF